MPRLLGAMFLLASSPALAALPPSLQRSRELRTVIVKVAPLLPEPIETIERVETDLYRVKAAGCTIEARIVDARPAGRSVPMAGRRFRVEVGQRACR